MNFFEIEMGNALMTAVVLQTSTGNGFTQTLDCLLGFSKRERSSIHF